MTLLSYSVLVSFLFSACVHILQLRFEMGSFFKTQLPFGEVTK